MLDEAAPAADAPAEAAPAAETAAPDWIYAAGPDRPETVPEKFWDAERGGVRVDAALTAYRELEGAYSRKREALAAELAAERRKGVPEKPEGYEFKVEPGTLPEGFEAILPPDDDPMLSTARSVLHELGASPEQFSKLSQAFLAWQMGTQPDVAAERAKMGESAEARIGAVDAWLARTVDETGYKALPEAVVTADGLAALEKLMRAAQAGIGAGNPGAGDGSPSETREEVMVLMGSPDYYHQTKGAAIRERVSAWIKANGPVYAPRR